MRSSLITRCLILCAAGFLLFFCIPSVEGQSAQSQVFKLTIDREHTVLRPRTENGKQIFYYTVPFQIHRTENDAIVTSVTKTDIVVLEDGKKVHGFELHQPRINKLTTVMALDISGSMSRLSGSSGKTKMQEAQEAARLFLNKLDERAATGLILFDHQLRQTIPPPRDPKQFQSSRNAIRGEIDRAVPQGGTAYLDATHRSVELLQDIKGRKAIVVMTDGVDVDSKRTLEEVGRFAQAAEIPVYTIGVGDPSPKDPVSTVLVLDQSGSMSIPARRGDSKTKIEALKESASRYVDLMGPQAKSTLIPFSNRIGRAGPFTNDRDELKQRFQHLRAIGGTSLYDATFEGIETLVAGQLPGKRYVVVLTDGVDESPGSRRSVEMVIQRAKEQEVRLYMLGLGNKANINEAVMKRMAQETEGQYFHAENEQKLFELFENVSVLLHGEGIDEAALKKLASMTGGKYHRARNAGELDLIYTQLAEELQSTYTVTFPSRYNKQDGTVSGIDIYVEREGKRISNVSQADLARHGLVVAEMHYGIYLLLLALLLALLAAPSGIRKLYRFYGGN